MIGVSLSLPLLSGNPACEAEKELLDEVGSTEALLRCLKEHGCGSVELRSIVPDTEAELAGQCIRAVSDAGLSRTIHGQLSDLDAETFFRPMLPAFSDEPLVITVHSLVTREETIAKLIEYHEYAEKHGLSCRFALENNRIKKGGSSVNTAEGVAETVAELDFMGTCFDFGHRYSDLMNFPEQTVLLPCEAFLKRAIHTHIHGYGTRTHFPLNIGKLPLHDYVSALKNAGYTGRYNLELEPNRYYGQCNILESYLQSLKILTEEVR